MDIARPNLAHRKRRRLIFIVAGTVILLAALTWVTALVGPAAPRVARDSVWIDTVRRGPLQLKVRGVGTLVPEDQRWLTARTTGRVETLDLLPGAALEEGSLILTLSNPELDQGASAARLQLTAAEAQFANTQAELEGGLLALQSILSQTEAAGQAARLEAEVNEALFAEGLVAELTLKKSRLAAGQLQTQYEIEQRRLEFQTNAMEKQLAAGRLTVEESRQRYELVKSQVEQLRVRAPGAGVLQRLLVTEGEQVTAGQNLAQVANPSRLKAIIRIPETQAKDIQAGQPASIDTRNGLIAGLVRRVNPTVENGTVDVEIRLTGALPKGARPDLTVEGSIELENLPDVLFVGRPAFSRENSAMTLFRIVPGGHLAHRIPVAFGRSSVTEIEIRSGLEAGDRVVLSDTSQYEKYDQLRLN